MGCRCHNERQNHETMCSSADFCVKGAIDGVRSVSHRHGRAPRSGESVGHRRVHTLPRLLLLLPRSLPPLLRSAVSGICRYCIRRKPNPGHIDGNDIVYHETTDASASSLQLNLISPARCLGVPRRATDVACFPCQKHSRAEMGGAFTVMTCRHKGSNRGPSDLQSDAHSAELRGMGEGATSRTTSASKKAATEATAAFL